MSRKSSSSASSSSTPYQLENNAGGAVTKYGKINIQDDFEDDHPGYYMSERAKNRIDNDTTLTEEDKRIIQYLACRKFHIPGKSFWEDYFYWFSNNHPFICFWTADPRHPLGKRERILNLLASLAFGLAATCCVILWFHKNVDRNFNNVAFSVPYMGNVTVGALALLLFSGPLHVIFDLSIYFVQACPPCRVGGFFDNYLPAAHQRCWLWIGAHVAFFITIAALSLAINVMFIRASIADGDGNDQDITTTPEHYSFLLLYLLEIFVSNFVAFPIGTFTVFSGVLGCGRIPGLGGRPYQVRKHQRMLERQAKLEAKKTKKPVV